MTKPRFKAIAIGASAGAFDALTKVFSRLPRSFPLPMIVVVHLPADRKSIMAGLLSAKCEIEVREAEEKDVLKAGTAYLAPPDYHLLVESDGRLALSSEEPVLYSRPAIDVLFESAADVFGPELLGVILTGASVDGADGLRAVIDAGGSGLVERPDLAYSSTMPEAALRLCPEASAMSLEEIAAYLFEAGNEL